MPSCPRRPARATARRGWRRSTCEGDLKRLDPRGLVLLLLVGNQDHSTTNQGDDGQENRECFQPRHGIALRIGSHDQSQQGTEERGGDATAEKGCVLAG